jgi:hypothetical protein
MFFLSLGRRIWHVLGVEIGAEVDGGFLKIACNGKKG